MNFKKLLIHGRLSPPQIEKQEKIENERETLLGVLTIENEYRFYPQCEQNKLIIFELFKLNTSFTIIKYFYTKQLLTYIIFLIKLQI